MKVSKSTDWVIEPKDRGIYLPQVDLWMDPQRPQKRALVSHAHFDHLAPHGEILASPPTARLLKARTPKGTKIREIPFGEVFPLGGGAVLKLTPAGHILGSAMAWVERVRPTRTSLLYTGDFKLREGGSSEACRPLKADVLVMETTYGLPRYLFPPSEKVMGEILAFCRGAVEDGEVPVLLGYSLGKSQELLAGLQKAGLPILLHPSVHRMTQIYRELGVNFPETEVWKKTGRKPERAVVIFPPQAAHSVQLRGIANRRVAAVTGWALAPGANYRLGCDMAFPLSDHADHAELKELVKKVHPKEIRTLHGFAAEFAAELREEGWNAWPVEGDTQLSLGLASQGGKKKKKPIGDPGPIPKSEFGSFVETLELAAATFRTQTKTEKLAEFFRTLSSSSLETVVRMLAGKGATLQVGLALIRRAVLAELELDPQAWKEAYARHQDSGRTVGELLTGKSKPQKWSLEALGRELEKLAKERGPTTKLAILKKLFRSMHPLEGTWLFKIMTGGLRAGVQEGLVEAALAKAFGRPLEEVRRAHMLTGDLAEAAVLAKKGKLGEAELTPGVPVKVMLASPEKNAAAILQRLAGAAAWAEDKYDGIRAQIHWGAGQTEIFSRDLKPIGDAFPELVEAARKLPGQGILDGEVLAWEKGKALPFSRLQRRLGRKEADLFFQQEVPVAFVAFDLLGLRGAGFLQEPWEKRRRKLEELMAKAPAGLLLAKATRVKEEASLEKRFTEAREAGNEGLIVKRGDSPYQPGQRGHQWLKLKKALATLDAVVTAVEWGHGKRKGLLSDYTFAVRDRKGGLKVIGKAYSGLTNEELAEWTEIFKGITLEVKGGKHRVRAEKVVEVAFDAVQSSDRHDSGFALRFPRIVRMRTDKKPEEADTIETVVKLAGGGRGKM
jgi:DNA ligase-1